MWGGDFGISNRLGPGGLEYSSEMRSSWTILHTIRVEKVVFRPHEYTKCILFTV